MNYGDIKSAFSSILNNRTATDDQVNTWLQLGIARIQRELRCPAMEKTLSFTCDGSIPGTITIPNDFIELIRLVNSNGDRLFKDDVTTVNKLAQYTGRPSYYCREGGSWLIGPAPEYGDTVKLVYYTELGTLSAPSDLIPLSIIAGDLFVYAGLTYAGDYFSDRRLERWEEKYGIILQSLQSMSDEDELSGGACVSPCYMIPDGI